MKHKIFGLFSDSHKADEAIIELNDKGFIHDTVQTKGNFMTKPNMTSSGTLVNQGFPEQVAKMYAERIKQGEVLVGVISDHALEDEVQAILKMHGADGSALVHIGE